MKQRRAPWYADGLRFGCTRCGRCCTGEGYVWLTRERIAAIADFLELNPNQFGRRYLRLVDGHLSLVEKAGGDCVFWERDQGCRIYPVRPTQCRTFPFWSENLESADSWRRVEAECPGSGEGRLYSADEIRRLLDET